MVVSAYLVNRERKTVLALRAAAVLSILAVLLSIAAVGLSPVLAISTLSALLLLAILRQVRAEG